MKKVLGEEKETVENAYHFPIIGKIDASSISLILANLVPLQGYYF